MDVANEYLMSSGMASPEELLWSEGMDMKVDHRSSAALTLPYDQSVLSRDVDVWIRGDSADTGVQGSGYAMAEHSTLTASPRASRLWATLALVLQVFTFNSHDHWRLTPSIVLNAAATLVSTARRVYERVRFHVRQYTQGHNLTSDTMATAMDVVLIIYAFGFLILFMYEASMFG